MPVMIFRLRGVPEDEAREVRALLDAHGIDYYETSAGNWGISLPALWLRDEERFAQARSLIEAYEAERAQRVRAEYAALKAAGRGRTAWDLLRENPLRFALYLVGVLLLLYVSLRPFFHFGH